VITRSDNRQLGGVRYQVEAPSAELLATTSPAVPGQQHWIRTAAAIIVGLLTIAGVVFALMQVQDWSF
jgi:hypothetical protein